MPRLCFLLAFALILNGFTVHLVLADEHTNLEEGLPVELEDAFPIAEHSRELQFISRLSESDYGEHELVIEPALELHFTPRWPFKLVLPFVREEDGKSLQRGNAGFEVFHNISQEKGPLPAFSISGRATFPTSAGASGIDTSIKFIASKTLRTSIDDRLHFNLSLRQNAGREEGERRNGYQLAFGYSRPFWDKTVVVLDVVKEQEFEEGQDPLFVEVGLRRAIGQEAILSLGSGIGLNKDASDYRLTLGVQLGF